MKQKTGQHIDDTICGIENIISQKIKSREVRISINAMAFVPELKDLTQPKESKDAEVNNRRLTDAIEECQTSIEKLLLIGDNLQENNVQVVKSLLNNNAFDIRTIDEIILILKRKKGIFRLSNLKSTEFKA